MRAIRLYDKNGKRIDIDTILSPTSTCKYSREQSDPNIMKPDAERGRHDKFINTNHVDKKHPTVIHIFLKTPTPVHKYSFSLTDDAPYRDPYSWTITQENIYDVKHREHLGSERLIRTKKFRMKPVGAIVRWEITGVRERGHGCQMSRFDFYNGREPLKVVSVRELRGSSPRDRDEGPDKLLDGDTTTKYYSESDRVELEFVLAEPQKWDGGYSFHTASDMPPRDPVKWRLYQVGGTGIKSEFTSPYPTPKAREAQMSRYQTDADLYEGKDAKKHRPAIKGHTMNPGDLIDLGICVGNGFTGEARKFLYLAENPPRCCLTVLKSAPLYQHNNRRQMYGELLAFMTHEGNPNIASFLGLFFERATMYLVIDFMNRGSLESVVEKVYKSKQKISNVALRHIARELCTGLQSLHEHRQIHRDFKPANVLVDATGAILISDFGMLQQLASADDTCTQGAGTWKFFSPERIKGRDYSYGADIWALGITLIYAATGVMPTKHCEGQFALKKMFEKNPEQPVSFLHEDHPDREKAFCDFVARCLKPVDRRASAEELLRDPYLADWTDPIDFRGFNGVVNDKQSHTLRSGDRVDMEMMFRIQLLQKCEFKGTDHASNVTSSVLPNVADYEFDYEFETTVVEDSYEPAETFTGDSVMRNIPESVIRDGNWPAELTDKALQYFKITRPDPAQNPNCHQLDCHQTYWDKDVNQARTWDVPITTMTDSFAKSYNVRHSLVVDLAEATINLVKMQFEQELKKRGLSHQQIMT